MKNINYVSEIFEELSKPPEYDIFGEITKELVVFTQSCIDLLFAIGILIIVIVLIIKVITKILR